MLFDAALLERLDVFLPLDTVFQVKLGSIKRVSSSPTVVMLSKRDSIPSTTDLLTERFPNAVSNCFNYTG